MRKRILIFGIAIFFGFNTTLKAQGVHKIKSDFFYQEWILTSINSKENLRIYKPNEQSNPKKINSSSAVLKFKKRNRVFYFISSKPLEKENALSWTKLRKPIGPIIDRCGTVYGKNKYQHSISRVSKIGKWKVYSKKGNQFLILKHFVLSENLGYTLEEKEKFQIVSLEENKMVLRKE